MTPVYLFLTSLGHFAADPGSFVSDCPDVTKDAAGRVCNTGLPKVGANDENMQYALRVLFGTLAAVAVLMIIISSLRLIANSGDPQATAQLRKTIIYAAVGLIISLSADVLVGYVLSWF